jgi:DNA (cytosine-5)-methyltransferase 1
MPLPGTFTARRLRLLDLFGGEGLASLGYALAGFDVTAIENDPERIANHARHPHVTVIEADATTYPLDGFDVIVGSPPCIDHTERAALAAHVRGRTAGTGWMLPHTLNRVRTWAQATGGTYVIENVEGAKPLMRSRWCSAAPCSASPMVAGTWSVTGCSSRTPS